MKNSGLFIGLGIGLLVGAAVGLYVATSDEKKTKLLDDIRFKVDDAKKHIEKTVKHGLEELDKAVEVVSHAAQNTISKINAKSEPKSSESI